MDELRNARYTQEGQRVTEFRSLASELFGSSEEGSEEEEHSVGESEEGIDDDGEDEGDGP